MSFNIYPPKLDEFSIQDCPFKVVDPSSLDTEIKTALDDFMAGASVPHPNFIYSHDYSRFCSMLENGSIKINRLTR